MAAKHIPLLKNLLVVTHDIQLLLALEFPHSLQSI